MEWRTHNLDGKFQVRLMVGFFTILSKNHSETLFIRLFDTSEFILIDLFSFSRKHKPRLITHTHTKHISISFSRLFTAQLRNFSINSFFCLPSIYLYDFRLLLFLSFNFPPIFQLFCLMAFFPLVYRILFLWFVWFFFRFSVEISFVLSLQNSLITLIISSCFFQQFYHFESYFHAHKWFQIPCSGNEKKTWKFDKCIWHKEDSSEIYWRKKKEEIR